MNNPTTEAARVNPSFTVGHCEHTPRTDAQPVIVGNKFAGVPIKFTRRLESENRELLAALINCEAWIRDQVDALDPVGGPGDCCGVNLGRAYADQARAAIAAATKGTP